jgi:hypothetical protein
MLKIVCFGFINFEFNMIHCSYSLLIRMRFCIFYNLRYLDIVWVEFYVVVNFGKVHFTAVIMPNFFFGLTGINVFMEFSVILF